MQDKNSLYHDSFNSPISLRLGRFNSFQANLKKYIQQILAEADIQIDGSRSWDLHVHNENLYQRVVIKGSLGLGEAYVEGWWDCERLDEFFARVLRAKLHKQSITYSLKYFLEVTKAKLWNLQSFSRSFQVGQHHYDLGNDLYQLMLDSRMTYSCGYWNYASNLEEAQVAKLDLICQKLNLKPGMTLLDIGCGWGSLMKYAAEHYGVSCVGLTVSKEQIKLGEKLCEGLPIQFLLQDYREFIGQFDRIASVGMFEHVGYKNYRLFMTVVDRCLKDDGLFLLHTIGNPESDTYGDLWVNKYIFPNGMLPSASQVSNAVERLFVIEDWHNFGHYYDLTLMAWWEKFNQHWSQLQPKYGDCFYRLWKYYLCSMAGSFRARNTHLWQIVCSKNGVPGGYASIR